MLLLAVLFVLLLFVLLLFIMMTIISSPARGPARHGRFPKFHRVCLRPRPWHIEIRHRVKKSPQSFCSDLRLKLKIRRLKLWKPTVYTAATTTNNNNNNNNDNNQYSNNNNNDSKYSNNKYIIMIVISPPARPCPSQFVEQICITK